MTNKAGLVMIEEGNVKELQVLDVEFGDDSEI